MLDSPAWEDEQFGPLKILQAMTQHRAVDLLEDVVPDLDDEVGPNPDYVTVEGGMVQFAHGHPVRDHRLTSRVAVGEDMGRVEQLDVVEPAQGARFPIGQQHPLAESQLMEPVPNETGDVLRLTSSTTSTERSARRTCGSSMATVNESAAGSSPTTKTGHSGRYHPGAVP
jgi:hypothetical protein